MGSADGAGAGDANERGGGGEMRASERWMREVAIRHGSDEATRRQGEATRRQGDEVTRRRGDETRRRDDDGDRNDAQTNDDQNGIEQATVGPQGIPGLKRGK
jgi:hypothetical protein